MEDRRRGHGALRFDRHATAGRHFLESTSFPGALLALLLTAAVGGGIWRSHARLGSDQAAQATRQDAAAQHVAVRGLIGSEKEDFFADPRVKQALEAQGITVTVEKADSRTIASRFDPAHYDFGFPSGAPAAQQLRAAAKAADVYTPFYTPIVVASWRPIAEILVANGVAKKEGEHYYIADMPALLAFAGKGMRWRELKQSDAFATGKGVLISTTDVRIVTSWYS